MKKMVKMAISIVMMTSMAMGSAIPAFAAVSLQQQVLAHNQKKITNQRMDDAAIQCYLVTERNMEERWTKKEPETGIWRFYETEGYTDKNEMVKKLSQKITANVTTEYEKCKAIHDWVCKNIWYDQDAFRYSEAHGGKFPVGFDTSPVSVLETKKTVCEGYTDLTVALLREAGIPAKEVGGYALGADTNGKWNESLVSGTRKLERNHVWTAAFVDGRWLMMDTTWDSRNKYENGRFGVQRAISQEYFDLTAEKLSKTHKILSVEMNIPPAELFNLTGEERMALWAERDRTEYPDKAIVSVSFPFIKVTER